MTKILDLFALAIGKTLTLLIQVLPPQLALFVARSVITFTFLVISRLRGVAYRNLQLIFPKKSQQEHAKILRGSLSMLALNLFGYVRSSRLSRQQALALCEYREAIELMEFARAKHPQTGIIMVTMHYGPFESMLHTHALLYRPMSVLARGFGLPKFDAWWNGRREVTGNTIFFRKGGFRQMVERLLKGEDICVLLDQNVKRKYAIFVNFFGIPAATSRAIGLAALRTGAQVVFGACVWDGHSRFQPMSAYIGNPADEPGSADEQIQRFTEKIHHHCEEAINAHPDHWFWVHRRFKTRPEGEPENFYD